MNYDLPLYDNCGVKPFIIWVGGKVHIIKYLIKYFPDMTNITKYAEPFIGGGSVLFYMLHNFKNIRQVYISDVNKDLILAYYTVKHYVNNLTVALRHINDYYISLPSNDAKNTYYLYVRDLFNKERHFDISNVAKEFAVKRTLTFLFLNKLSFSSTVFRVNSKGEFNSSFKSPKTANFINDVYLNNLMLVSEVLNNIDITLICGDYFHCDDFVDDHTFVYFDPPYMPSNKTGAQTKYNSKVFDSNSQIELCNFYQKLSDKNARLMMSNADILSDRGDPFLNNLYSNHNIYSFNVIRHTTGMSVKELSELVVTNY
jgi:DNA adenine methylase